jgi:hypothetical protein
MHMRSELVAIVDLLLARNEPELSLDVVADAIGAAQVSVDEIDLIFRALEDQDRRITQEDTRSASAELGLTLKAARRLRDTLKRSPTPEEIAKEAGITLTSVRCALLFARILQR